MGIIRFLKQGRTLTLALVWLTLLNSAVQAQLIPDNTLGTENSIVSPQGARDLIEGGAKRGSNLFHSFSEFNVNVDQQVYFANPDGIANILTRVTGDTISNIFGTLGVDGNANLFLLNPNGILFGVDAQLDVAGSFIASTADGIKLGNDGVFRATNPQDSQLLTIQPGVFFLDALRQQQAEIRNQGNLNVGTGKTLILAGDRVISTGSLTAPGGTIQVFGEDVQLLETARINVSSLTGGGSVTIGQGEQVTIAEGVQIQADSLNQGDGGRVIIRGNKTTQFAGTITARGASDHSQSNGGFVDVSGGYLDFTGIVDTTAPLGEVGTLLLDPKKIWIDDGIDPADGKTFETNPTEVSIINPDTLDSALATNSVTLQANNDITINQSMFSGSNNSLTLQAGRSIIINKLILLDGGNFTAKINDENAIAAQRDAGVAQFLMNPGSILVTNGGSIEITSGTFADTSQINTAKSTISTVDALSNSGSSGDINLFALGNVTTGILNTGRDITENVVANNGGNITIKSENGAIATTGSVTSDGINQGGNVLLEARGDLNVNENITSTSTEGIGGNITLKSEMGNINANSQNQEAGDISLNATGDLSINKTIASDGNFAGQITLNSGGLFWLRGNNITNSSKVPGVAKGITITAQSIRVEDGSIVSSAFNEAQGGMVQINAVDEVMIRNSNIGTVAAPAVPDSAEMSSADAGDITLNTRRLTIIKDPETTLFEVGVGSTADKSNSGNAGDVMINATESIKIIGNQPGAFNPNPFELEQVVSGVNRLDTGITAFDLGSGNSGNLTINTGRLSIRDGGGITTFVKEGEGGDLTVNATDIFLQGKSGIGTGTLGEDAGDLTLNAENVFLTDGAFLSTSTRGNGNAGNLTLEVRNLSIRNGAVVFGHTLADGNGGNIRLNLERLQLNNGWINAWTSSSGNGGDIRIRASESVEVTGAGFEALQEQIVNPAFADTLTLDNFSQGIVTITDGEGAAGNVFIETPNFIARDGGLITTTTLSQGRGGNIQIDATNRIELDNSLLASGTLDQADSGNVTLTSPRLIARGGAQVLTTTFDSGQAGDLYVNVSELIELSDPTNEGTLIGTGLFASSTEAASGDGGDININSPTSELNIRDRAAVSVSATGTGNAGDINIDIRSIFLDQGLISATSLSGEGGNINLKVAETLILRNNSQISTRAGTESSGGGNGGDMTIEANFIVGVLSENSDLTANAFAGNGGNITITTQTILGLQVSEILTPNSDITASSKLGIDGSIVINTPNIDPSRGLFELPLNFFDASQQLVSGCPADTGDRFIVTGRGGIPNPPSQYLSGRAIWEDTRRLSSQISPSSTATNSQRLQTNPQPLIEAQGWVVDKDGTVILTAQPYRGKQVNIGINFRTCGSQLNYWWK